MSDFHHLIEFRKLSRCKTLEEFKAGIIDYWNNGFETGVPMNAMKIFGNEKWANKFMDTLVHLYQIKAIDGLFCPDNDNYEFKKVWMTN